ncbi:MAG TPA: DUF1127 domain-containing protein [Magnetospirillaceae bacterium]|jgi:uncharacterized protein YjiS (DUF1127 family)
MVLTQTLRLVQPAVRPEAIIQGLLDLVRLWRRRARERAELAGLTEYELHDFGASRSAVAGEMKKPFWRP